MLRAPSRRAARERSASPRLQAPSPLLQTLESRSLGFGDFASEPRALSAIPSSRLFWPRTVGLRQAQLTIGRAGEEACSGLDSPTSSSQEAASSPLSSRQIPPRARAPASPRSAPRARPLVLTFAAPGVYRRRREAGPGAADLVPGWGRGRPRAAAVLSQRAPLPQAPGTPEPPPTPTPRRTPRNRPAPAPR